jgi:RsiW-degrading membrane proteinase PrsW (M82 family)
LHPPASYALAGSPLRKPWAAVLILVALGVLILFALLQLVSIFAFAPANVLRVFFSALGLAIVAGLPALALIWYLDRREREAPWLFFGALFWGMLVATGLALFLNGEGALLIFNFYTRSGLASEVPSQDAGRALVQYLTAVLVGPPVEEIVKGLALILLIWLLRGEFNNMRDGIIYGALVGLGFNMMETAFYITMYVSLVDLPKRKRPLRGSRRPKSTRAGACAGSYSVTSHLSAISASRLSA